MTGSVLLLGADAETGPTSGERPRRDVDEIARALNAWRSPSPPLTGLRARLLTPLPGDFHHAWRVRRAPVAGFLSLSEGTGLPLALLGTGAAAHVMIAHNLTATRRRAVQRLTRYLERIDRIIVLSRGQEVFLREKVGLPVDRVQFLFDKVDHHFFAPQGRQGDGGYVLSVGAEARDYPTLLRALRRLEVPAVIVASSLWVGPAELDGDLPAGVTVRRGVPFSELRELYDRAAVVVVPVRAGTRYAAGVNALLEAMSMRRPLVVTDTPGLAGYAEDGVTASVVPPEDPAALAEAIRALIGDRARADSLAAAGRAVVDGDRNLDVYVADVTATVRGAVESRIGS